MKKQIRVLIIEDSEDDAFLEINELIIGGFDIVWERVETREAFLSAISKSWDCIISDYSLPKYSGTEALEEYKKSGLDIPFIIVSGTIGEETAVAAMRGGAHDYILKDKMQRLAPAIERELREAEIRRQNKQAEEEIRKFKLGIERSSDIVFITDPEGVIRYANKSFEKVYGFSQEETIGKTPRILKSGTIPLERYENFWSTLLRKDVFSGEILNKTKDGHLLTVEVSHNPILNENDSIIGFLAVHRDITARKLAEVELIKAKEKAEESDRLKSAFLANMSHEIRTPLNSIIGFSELIIDPSFELEQHSKFAKLINVSGNNLLAIITDIMDISKIESGQIQITKTQFPVNKLINSIYNEYVFKAIEKGIELRIDNLIQKMEVIINTDYSRLKQIIEKLVVNAIKFTERGVIEVGIKKVGNYIQFQVVDSGIGIPKEFHEKIFERFRQVEAADTRKHGGNGLGLPISKGLVELLGGAIWLESELGKGSTFYFLIPITEKLEEQRAFKISNRQSSV